MMGPSVSVLVPTFNEVGHIERCLETLAAQDYEAVVEIVVVDGGSEDGTLAVVEKWAGDGVVVVHNPDRVQSAGLNLAAHRANGEILIRADAHSTYGPGYISRSVAVLTETGAQAVGGPMRVRGRTPFENAVAAAMSNPLGVGPAAFHDAEASGPVDTVYLGAFWRAHFLERGGYRSLPSGVAEDADMYYRWRQAGDTIWLDPSIESAYRPRGTWRALARQFFRYGRGKADMLIMNRRVPSLRPLAPVGLVLAMLASLVVWAFTGHIGLLIFVAGSWFTTLVGVWLFSARRHWRVVGVIAVMHVTYGSGFLVSSLLDPWSLLRGGEPRKAGDS
ncbi:MAG: glycosyltransferase family 2 protein [Acidimicrobiia bacterium]|nr:glycosyltransferase family 2 protein [Acidimicrobiia bacterium]